MKRKTDRHLPPCVYWKHGQHWLVKKGKWTALGVDLSTALAEYGRILGTPKGGMSDLIDAALARMEPDLAPSTRSQYQTAARRLKTILAEFSPDQVRPKHVAQIKASLSKTPNMGNRIISVLRGVFDYALEMQIVEFNPATGVKRHKEAKRERLIAPDEYQAIYAQAGERLQIIMDLLVPKEPTKEMQHAYMNSIDANMHRVEKEILFGRYDNHRLAYRAMLAAAPAAPQSPKCKHGQPDGECGYCQHDSAVDAAERMK